MNMRREPVLMQNVYDSSNVLFLLFRICASSFIAGDGQTTDAYESDDTTVLPLQEHITGQRDTICAAF